MDASTIFTISAAVIAAASLYYTARAANAARQQTALQRQIREDSAQPYVWADLRPSTEHGQLMTLIVGNTGPTVATNVQVSISPDPVHSDPARGHGAVKDLQRGLTALAPGRHITWTLGTPFAFFEDGATAPEFTIAITADGPFGPTAPLAYSINLEAWRHSSTEVEGTLRGVAKAIEKGFREGHKSRTHFR